MGVSANSNRFERFTTPSLRLCRRSYDSPMSNIQEPVEIEGHLIDSGILKYAFDKIVEHGGQFEVLDFRIGKNNQETSKVRLMVRATGQEQLEKILAALEDFGAVVDWDDCQFVAVRRDSILPD